MADSIKCVELTEELAKVIQSHCSRLPPGEIRVEGCTLPSVYKKYIDDIINFEVRDDDVWILSYPKCGTTWTQEMVWLLVNNLDFDTAKKLKIYERSPFLEYVGIGGEMNTIEHANKATSPRIMKCHLPIQLLPKQLFTKKPKMVYVYRDPRDAVISYYYHLQLWYNYLGSMEEHLEAFQQCLVPYDPFWDHVIKFWESRKELNLCFNTFEEMKEDLGSVIDKTCKYLNVNISSAGKSKLIEHLSFNSMQKNDSVNYSSDKESSKFKNNQFIREGKSGGWKQKLTKEQIDKLDKQAEKYLKNSDFPHYKMYCENF